MNQKQIRGKVVLVGAGPGDPELLTLKAYRFLQVADVVITDRLVSNAILENYVNKNALVLHVGKEGGKDYSTAQSLINELMVEYASQQKLVVRLKGGDVSFFSNILDELTALCRQGIDYELIPGVTAASGAAACAGIPLTARGYANAVRFLTYYKTDLLDTSYWLDLTRTSDTLVFYMSSNTIDDLVQKFISHDRVHKKYISIIEQATTPQQRVFTCSLAEYKNKWGNTKFVSPTLIVIGKVVGLQRHFQWWPEASSKENYFEPLTDKKKTDARA
jgi:uroporphyrin-III C-methyltransferase